MKMTANSGAFSLGHSQAKRKFLQTLTIRFYWQYKQGGLLEA